MKDYRLSEIKAICEKMHNEFGENACIYCENNGLGDFCSVEFENYPTDWYVDIEPRDMIELPCKELRTESFGNIWDVYHRNAKYGFIQHEYFNTEAEADAFLAELKGDKK